MCYMFLFLPVNFPSVIALDQKGLKVGVLIGISFTTTGLILRIMINHDFKWVIAGQTLMAVGQPFMYNAPAKVTTNWFPYKERAIATMIGTSANILGVTLGFLLPSLFIDEYIAESDYSDAEMDKYRLQVRVMLIAFACFAIYALL